MPKKLKRALILTAGIVFIIFGLVGLVVPLMPQILFFAIGFILLSLWSPRIREYLDRHTIRFPKVHKIIRDVEGWVVRLIGEP